MASQINPDLLYLLPRESLLVFEDARLFGLLQAVCNYYSPRNDQPMWGGLMRAIAQELARLDYNYQYDVVTGEPQYLTPPDARRRWAGPLSVGRNFPPPAQFDKGDFTGSPVVPSLTNPVGYRDMLVDLLAAYRLGATSKAIEDVIYAYTGKAIKVVELYTQIGQGVYDQSDRNAIQVSVNAFGSNPLTEVQSLGQLQEIVRSLYGAIDLAKPAHVGLEFTTVFGETENLPMSIIDTLRIIVQQIEAAPLDPMLWIAPIFDVKHPKTTLASFGRRMTPFLTYAQWTALQALPAPWDPAATYARGILASLSTISPPMASYLMYRALKKNVGQSPASSPSYWKQLPSPAAWQAYHPLPSGAYILGIAPWAGGSPFYAGQFILDPNGNLQVATTGGISGASVTFSTTKGDITDDNGILWENLGTSYLTSPQKWIQVVDKTGSPTGEVANWNVASPMGLVAPRESNAWEIRKDSLQVLNFD